MDYVNKSAVRFMGYITDFLFVPVELYVWQVLVIFDDGGCFHLDDF